MPSYVQFDVWQNTSGINRNTILQVVSGTLSSSGSTASTSFIDVGLQATITPYFASSKILILAYLHMSNDGQNGTYMRVLRDGVLNTATVGNDQGNGINDGTGGTVRAASGFIPYSSVGYHVSPNRLDYLDSAGSTSSTTYKCQARTGTGGTARWNRQGNSGGTNADFGWYNSTITLMEISQ